MELTWYNSETLKAVDKSVQVGNSLAITS